jgi:NTP pyrophosphatase (non-canonical NTP hydrolase)
MSTDQIAYDGEMAMPQTPDTSIPGVEGKVYLTNEINMEEQGYVAIPAGTSIPELQRAIHEWAISKEWRGPNAETQRTTGDDIALICSEAAEALEAFRELADPQAVWYTYSVEVQGVKFKNLKIEQLMVLLNCDDLEETQNMIDELGLEAKPEGVGPELADLVIRVLDYCQEHGLELLHFIMEKMAHNHTREIRHGGMHL